MTLSIDLWQLLIGALCGLAAVYGARGRNRMVAAALIGAATAFLLGILRGLI